MPLRLLASFVAVVILTSLSTATGAEPPVTQPALRNAIEKSLPLLMKGAVGHRENRTCFACHQQGPPIMALAAARSHGFAVDDEELTRQAAFIANFLDGNRENYLQGKGTGGQADTAGYALWALAAAGWKPDGTTSAVAEYLLLRHKDKEYWLNTSNRPPSEAGPFTTTYVALYGLSSYGTTEQQERIAARTEQVRLWLTKSPAKDNEDRVFRLLALHSCGAKDHEIAAAAKELLGKQRDDGGWAQLDSGEPASATESDAYATGSALVALHEAGGLATDDPAYQKALAYLLKTQHDDGSWRVVSRSKPFQPYYESGFPHGKDQFISCAASGWATWAMVLACSK
jgi:squalene-hopene cyclase-like protein